MAVYYDKTVDYGGQTFSLRVDVHTSQTADAQGRTTWLNTITVHGYDGIDQIIDDATDEQLIGGRLTDLENVQLRLIDGIPNTQVDTTLIDNGYTRH